MCSCKNKKTVQTNNVNENDAKSSEKQTVKVVSKNGLNSKKD